MTELTLITQQQFNLGIFITFGIILFIFIDLYDKIREIRNENAKGWMYKNWLKSSYREFIQSCKIFKMEKCKKCEDIKKLIEQAEDIGYECIYIKKLEEILKWEKQLLKVKCW